MRLSCRIRGLTILLAMLVSVGARAADAPAPPPPPDDADTRVLLEDVTLSFGVDRKTGKPYADLDMHQRIRILREDGDSAASRSVSYRKGRSDVLRIEGSTTLPDGRVERLDPKDVTDSLAIPEDELFSDTRVKRFTLPLATKGAVLDYRYVQRDYELVGAFLERMGNAAPTDRVRFRVVVPQGAVVEHVVMRGNDPADLPPVESDLPDGARDRVWELSDVPGDIAEPFAPARSYSQILVMVALKSMPVDGRTFTGMPDLPALVAWVDARYREQSRPDKGLEAQARQILAEAGQPVEARDKARALYEWVQDHIRYVAVELGDGGWIPHAAGSVLATRYGDCKDKANLLAAMLRTVGIESVPVMVLTREGPVRRVVMPSRGRFNHAILGVRLGDALVLADPTSTTVPFGQLPAGDQDADIMVADPARPRMEHTPRDPAESSRKEERTDLQVLPDGSLAGTFAIRFVGAKAHAARASYRVRTPKSRKDYVKENLELTLDGLEIESCEPPVGTARDDTFELTGRLRGLAPVAWSGGTALVQARSLVGYSEASPSGDARRAAFQREWSSTETVRATVHFPHPARAVSRDWGGTREGVTGTYRWSGSVVDGALVVERSATFHPAQVGAADFGTVIAPVFRAVSASDAPLRVEFGGEVKP